MSEQDGLLRAVEPARRSRVRLGSVVVWLFGLFVGLFLADGERELTCEAAVRRGTMGLAATVCQREYAATGAPGTGIRLADSLMQSDRLVDAKLVAQSLVGTSRQADAWQVLGRVAWKEHQIDGALVFLELARVQHAGLAASADAARDHVARATASADVARDSLALATVLRGSDRYGEALALLEDCVTRSRQAADPGVEYYCHLAAESVLRKVGLLELAASELEIASEVAAAMPTYGSREQAELAYMRGILEQETEGGGRRRNHGELAIAAFQRSLRLNETAQLTLGISAERNLAISLASAGRLDEAAHHLARARAADVQGTREPLAIQVEAQIAYRRGDTARAFALNDGVYDRVDDSDRVDLATMQARIALADGKPELAEEWARRGIAAAEAIRGKQHTLELRPWVLSRRRVPYELRFVALVRAGRLEDAVTTLDQWQGRTLLDALATPAPQDGVPGAARELKALGTWLPVASRGAFAREADRGGVLATLRTIDLLALVVADGDVWCVTARHGELRAHDLGPLAALQGRLDAFITVPTQRALAAELGALILRDGIARPTTAALHVIVDGPLAALPVAALRLAAPLRDPAVMTLHDDSPPLIAVRPVLRVPRVPELRCVAARRPTHATVLADPFDDLPRARDEATALTKLFVLNSTTSLGTGATSAALFATSPGDLLHLAIHAEVGAGNGVLVMRDRNVSALEIAARKIRAALVVLSACESARSADDDVELAGSLTTAFLASGASQVIATVRVVSDPGAAALVTRFYQAGGLTDPVRALAAAQAQLADTSDTDWPRFAIFGHDLCLPTP